ncbi:organic hydroperoxide resistance protein [Shimazuella kribbensis]|uniref:organic hydroperoxide resistance protein n=1 Tax=Shimazuella kribbensis TaxID=139808 RepID=UPI0004119D74|nr:organic hydroperoxide resistance protein [Shimazuella kribbensis]
MQTLYTAKVTAEGGRNGRVVSDDGILDLDVKMPKSLGGPGGEATNPEQLFAAGYAACFDSALNLVTRKKRLKEVEHTKVTANVSIGRDTDNGLSLAVQLDVQVIGVDKNTAQELVEAAHQVCPYSRATRGNIDVIIHVVE